MEFDANKLGDAKSALQSFFSAPQKGQNPKASVAEESNPAAKILNQIQQEKVPPNKRSVTKVDNQSTSKENVETMSVDEAEGILNVRKDFNEILKELGIKHSDLFPIIDAFLEKGYYEDRYKVKSLEFVFRTKKIHSVDTINDVLDGSKYVTPTAAGHLLLERTMAASLYYFKLGKNPPMVFDHNSEEDDEKVLEFIRKELSIPIYAILSQKLRKFELYTGLASREEAIDYFLAHTQD